MMHTRNPSTQEAGQEDHVKFKASPVYTASSRLGWRTMHLVRAKSQTAMLHSTRRGQETGRRGFIKNSRKHRETLLTGLHNDLTGHVSG